MINGRLYDARTMHQIGNHPEKRRAFFWENGEANARGGCAFAPAAANTAMRRTNGLTWDTTE